MIYYLFIFPSLLLHKAEVLKAWFEIPGGPETMIRIQLSSIKWDINKIENI